MSKEQYQEPLKNTFLQGAVRDVLNVREGGLYCAIFNFTNVTKELDITERAKAFVKAGPNSSVEELYQPAFKESGLSNNSFNGFVGSLVYQNLLMNRVEGLNMKEPGVVAFVSDEKTVNDLMKNFPFQKFAFYYHSDPKKMTDFTENHLRRFRESQEQGAVVECRHLDA